MAQGYVRDLVPRWALEELGLSYQVRQVNREERTSEQYLKLQPFGQVPVYEEDGLVLFESGAIALHIAEKSEMLMPKDKKSQAQVKAWMFAVANSLDPHVRNFQQIEFFSADEEWAPLRRPAMIAGLKICLQPLEKYLDGREYLVNEFSAADILMTVILRNIGPDALITSSPNLNHYIHRCESRPAFQTALTKQIASFSGPDP